MSQKIIELIAKRKTEELKTSLRDAKVREQESQRTKEQEIVIADMPKIWKDFKANIEADCKDSDPEKDVLTFTANIVDDHSLHVVSAWGWLQLNVVFNAASAEIVARCRTDHRTGPERWLWEKIYSGTYHDDQTYLCQKGLPPAEPLILFTPANASEALVMALLSTDDMPSRRPQEDAVETVEAGT
jgi:hypothetical protein